MFAIFHYFLRGGVDYHCKPHENLEAYNFFAPHPFLGFISFSCEVLSLLLWTCLLILFCVAWLWISLFYLLNNCVTFTDVLWEV